MRRMGMARWHRTVLLIAAAGFALPASGCGHVPKTVPVGGAPSTSLPAVVPSSSAPRPTLTASASAQPAPKPSPKRIAARVVVQRTGGFAGVAQKLVVEADGSWRYTVERGPGTGTVKTGRLGAARRERLHLLLGDPSFGSASYPGACADGLHYSLVTGQGSVEWDECGAANPATVAQAIVALLAAATPF